MKEKISPLHSPYIIDGVRQELSPARILESVCDFPFDEGEGNAYAPVVDETADTDPAAPELDPRKVEKYFAAASSSAARSFGSALSMT